MTIAGSSLNSSESDAARPNKPGILVVLIGSACYAGFAPVASGTVGSAVALAAYWLIPPMQSWTILLPAVVVSFALGVPVASAMERHYGKDPSEVVWDEVVGMWIALLFLPARWYIAATAFFVFRLFDIVKPPPARHFDRMPGGFGIMMDDVIAGIYANIVVHALVIIASMR